MFFNVFIIGIYKTNCGKIYVVHDIAERFLSKLFDSTTYTFLFLETDINMLGNSIYNNTILLHTKIILFSYIIVIHFANNDYSLLN